MTQQRKQHEMRRTTKRVNTHYAETCYPIAGVTDETMNPTQMLAMFHLMYLVVICS